MRLLRIPEPFDHSAFIFEPKVDGFRALAHIHGHRCEMISRNGHTFESWPYLAFEGAVFRRKRTRPLSRKGLDGERRTCGAADTVSRASAFTIAGCGKRLWARHVSVTYEICIRRTARPAINGRTRSGAATRESLVTRHALEPVLRELRHTRRGYQRDG